MLPFGVTRYVDLRIYNGVTPVTGLTLASLQVYFTRKGVTCTDTLNFAELGNGHYQIHYDPTSTGHDYLEVAYSAVNYLLQTSEDIIDIGALFGSNNAVTITQNYPTTNFLVPQGSSMSQYTLYVYYSSDWVAGNTDSSQSLASTALTDAGSWVENSFILLHGTYHFILRNLAGNVIVFKAFLGI